MVKKKIAFFLGMIFIPLAFVGIYGIQTGAWDTGSVVTSISGGGDVYKDSANVFTTTQTIQGNINIIDTITQTGSSDTSDQYWSNDTLYLKDRKGSAYLNLQDYSIIFKSGTMYYDDVQPQTQDSLSSQIGTDANPYGEGHFAYIDVKDSLKASTSLWWFCHKMSAVNLSSGGSGATEVTPSAHTLGGYQFDNSSEFLYVSESVHDNWDGESDMEVIVRWELNAASTNASDSVFLTLNCLYKKAGEDTTGSQSSTVGVLVGNQSQYTMNTTTFTIDYDLTNNEISAGDVISFKLNLDTANSDVDNVIINFFNFRYKTRVPQPTTY